MWCTDRIATKVGSAAAAGPVSGLALAVPVRCAVKRDELGHR